jgi:hypothetical protein
MKLVFRKPLGKMAAPRVKVRAKPKSPRSWMTEGEVIRCLNCGEEYTGDGDRFKDFLAPHYAHRTSPIINENFAWEKK